MSTVEERSLIKLNVEADVATIVLNRPDVRNALNRQLMIDLIDVAQLSPYPTERIYVRFCLPPRAKIFRSVPT